MRQEKRAYRKAQRELDKAQLNLTTKEMAVFFIAQQNKLAKISW
jgi:hypothetical protein